MRSTDRPTDDPPADGRLAIEVRGLHKHYGETRALDGVDLDVAPGGVVGLLGPNGAGKTTLVRVLATLLAPTSGTAHIFGLDVLRRAARVRDLISLTGQYAAIDELLTGRENLLMFGELLQLTPRSARKRADELLERFDLVESANRRASTYSGGMRRRLDLASSVIVPPRLLFLDEPTTGLDPRTRNQMWEVIRELVGSGTTLLLTTQYLEEADQLADRILVIDHGRIIADGSGDELKDAAGGITVEVLLGPGADIDAACTVLQDAGLAAEPVRGPQVDLEVPTDAGDGLATVRSVAATLEDAGTPVRDLGLRRATLDEVFLQLTGQPAAPDPTDDDLEEGVCA